MKNKLGLIITIAIVGILVVTSIILGVVKKDYSPNLKSQPNSIMITDKDSTKRYDIGRGLDGKQKEDFEKFVNLYNNMFKESVLASMFSGNLNNEVVINYQSGSVPSKTGYRVIINYPSSKIKTGNDLEYSFEQVVLNIEDKSGVRELSIYIVIKDVTAGYIQVQTLANTQSLYDFVSELDFK